MKYTKETKRFHSPLTGGVLPEPLAAKLFFGLVSGLQYLHGKRICHRDIKVRPSVWGWLVGTWRQKIKEGNVSALLRRPLPPPSPSPAQAAAGERCRVCAPSRSRSV
jgi:serine/threonine protein kinase